MKKLNLFIFILLLSINIFPQVPQRLSYQAVIRNSNNTLASNQTVKMRISIIKGSPEGTAVYVETHVATTNANGVVAIEIGGGTVITGSFTGINWADGPSYIKTEADPTGGENYTLTSTNQLLSVPYALVAEKVSGSLPKLEIKGNTENMEEPLFEIKNKNGQTVFAVYNEGVRIYVDDGSKGTKGGFAIGGFGDKKEGYQDLFVVSPDSIRAYVDPGNEEKGTKGGFAIGSFSDSKSSRREYFRVTNDSTRIYLANSETKGTKGGFAIGTFSDSKSQPLNLMFINQDSSIFYLRKTASGSSTKFDITGIDENNIRKSLLSANADTVGIQGVLNLQNNLIVSGNINIGGSIKQDALPVSDIDGNIYQTVLIGQQVWMAENLRTTRYSNGEEIGTTASPFDDINEENEPKYQWAYNGDEGSVPVYGRLYTWYAATDPRKICPTGFHIPSSEEFNELIWYLVENNFGNEMEPYAVAKAIASNTLWTVYENPEAPFSVGYEQETNNATGFNALPAGLRNTFTSTFVDMGLSAHFWTSITSLEDQSSALIYSLSYDNSYVEENENVKFTGYSIRCIKDR